MIHDRNLKQKSCDTVPSSLWRRRLENTNSSAAAYRDRQNCPRLNCTLDLTEPRALDEESTPLPFFVKKFINVSAVTLFLCYFGSRGGRWTLDIP
jgi:hypothetical protein